MKLLTLDEAIEETESMWRDLARKRGNAKPVTTWMHNCPCCEYVFQKLFGKHSEEQCIMAQSQSDYENKVESYPNSTVIFCIDDCPMRELWPDGCESSSSPYHKWGDIYDDTSEYAEEIADFAKDLKEDKP